MDTIHYSSEKMDWRTPIEVFHPLDMEFKFDLDVACTSDNCLCSYGLALDQGINGLTENWQEYMEEIVDYPTCWMNPPYGREIAKWIQKAWDEKYNGQTTVCLVPARTDTKWWSIFYDHNSYQLRDSNDEMRFLRGRIRFEGAKHPAPFPSAIIVLRGVR